MVHFFFLFCTLLVLLLFLGSGLLPNSQAQAKSFFSFHHTPAFASGGFGGMGTGAGAGSNKALKKKGKGKQKVTTKKNKAKATPSVLDTPQDRMAYIQSRIEAADVSPLVKLKLLQSSDNNNINDNLVMDIDPNEICVVDNFLNHPRLLAAMRQEAESILPSMVPSQSTRWDEETQQVVPYEKVGVLSTQIQGGVQGYETTPRLVEYIVTLTQHLTCKLNSMLPPNHQLDETQQTNKLAVCLGDGSKYDKHIDNLGGGEGGDRRKLTALLYLQPAGSHDDQPDYPNESDQDDPRGGYFRAYDVPNPDDTDTNTNTKNNQVGIRHIAPRGDRLILFWSDALVHDVSPSFAPNGDKDRRWALTTWLVAAPNAVIRDTDPLVEQTHFGTGTTGKG